MISQKLLQFQSRPIHIVKDSSASVGGGRQYRYASLPSVLAAVRPALSECGLVLVQRIEGESLVTQIIDPATGEAITGQFPLAFSGLTWHGIGSAITYARRYAILAALGLAPDDDDDAVVTLPPERQEGRNGHASGLNSHSQPSQHNGHTSGHSHTNGHQVPACPQCDNIGIKSKYGSGYYCGKCRRPYEPLNVN